MSDALARQVDFIFFVYGLAFILMAAVAQGLLRHRSERLPWKWFCLFGFAHGIHEWLDMAAVSLDDSPAFAVCRLLSMTVSFLFLAEFARAGSRAVGGPRIGLWIYIPMLAAANAGAIEGVPGLNAAVRYSIALPAAAGAAGVLWSWRRLLRGEPGARLRAGLAAGSMLAYAVAAGLIPPPSDIGLGRILNTGTFLDRTGFPVQLLRTACAATLAIVLWQHYRSIRRHHVPTSTLFRFDQWLVLLLITVLALGWVLVEDIGDKEQRQEELSYQARLSSAKSTLENAVETADRLVRSLSGAPGMTGLSPADAGALEAANDVLDRYSRILRDSIAYVMAPDGIVAASSNRDSPTSFVGHSYASRPYFRQAAAGEPGRYVAIGLTSGLPGYYASCPITKGGRTVGVAVIKINIRGYLPPLSHGEVGYLVDRHGIVLYASDPSSYLRPLWPLSPSIRARLLESLQFPTIGASPVLDAVPRTGARCPLGGRTFMVFRQITGAEGMSIVVLGRMDRPRIWRLIGILLTLPCIVLLLGFFIVQRRSQESVDEETAALLRVRRQQEALLRVTASATAIDGDMAGAARLITAEAAAALSVARAGLWTLDRKAGEFRCMDLYDAATGEHTAGMRVAVASCPTYCAALAAARSIDAADADADARTREFGAARPGEEGTARARLDAAVRMEGRLVGVLCHESLNATRAWIGDEVRFAAEMADQAAQVLVNHQRRQAERELADAWDLNQKMIAASSIGIAAYRAAGPCVFANEAMARIVSGSAEELVRMDFRRIESWRTSGLLDLAANALQSGIPASGEIHMLTTFGRDVWMAYHLARFESRGEPHLLLVAHDISEQKHAQQLLQASRDELEARVRDRTTELSRANDQLQAQVAERQRAELALKESESRYRTLIESTDAIPWEFDLEHDRWTYVAPQAERILGYPPTEWTQFAFWTARVHPDDREWVSEYSRDCTDRGETHSFEYRFMARDGRTVWLRDLISVEMAGKRPVRLRGYMLDVTERRHAEEALRSSKEHLEATLNALPDLLFEVDRDGRIYDFRAPKPNQLYVPPDQFLGRRMTDILPEQASTVIAAGLAEAAQTGVHRGGTYALDMPGGAAWYEISVAARGSPSRPDAHFILLVHNITERMQAEEARKRLEAQMLQTQKLESMGVLAGGIAHDFNNILMAIIGNLDLALSDMPGAHPMRRNLEEAGRAAQRAADLTQQMLAYSGRGRFVVEAIDLSALVRDTAKMLEVSISKKARTEYRLDDDLPAVEGDATQIRQIVMNLVINASEAIGEQTGRITISTGAQTCTRSDWAATWLKEDLPEGDYAWIEVSDTGCGMDAATLARIFDPFFTTKFTGRGLGLAAVLGIVRGHRGAIGVESQPAQGTTVRVFLPATRHATPPAPEEPATPRQLKESGTILMADDEPAVREVCRLMLERLGFETVGAADGREAVDLFVASPDRFRCVILDLTMPRMDGDEAFTELRKISPDVRVILCSGYGEQELSKRFAGRGLAGFLQKPYRYEALAAAIHQAIGA